MKNTKKIRVQRDPSAHYLSVFMCIGLAVGLVFGRIFKNTPAGLSVGMCLGAIIGVILDYYTRIRSVDDLKFSEASAEDSKKILALYMSCATPENKWNAAYPNSEIIESDISLGGLFVLKAGKRIVGSISIVPEDDLDHEVKNWAGSRSFVLGRLAVSPDFRRMGLARRLIDEMMRLAASRGGDSVRFLCNIGNAPALTLYESMGFEVRGEVSMYGSDYYAIEAALASPVLDPSGQMSYN